MNVLSLFDGMSCGQIALNRLGIEYENYYASEIDKYAIQITQKNYPNTLQLGDIRNIHATDLPEIDLLLGGSPCQGFSVAGKHLNFDDPRSSLFFEYVRLLRELNPRYFILENVKMKKEFQDIISEYLGVQPIEINSSLVSAQNRKRLYWTNIKGIQQPEDREIYLKDIVEGSGYIKNHGTYTLKNDKAMCLDANYFKGVDNHGQRTVIEVASLTERRTEKAKQIRRDFKKKYGKDFSPRREKELVERTDGKSNCLTANLSDKEHTILIKRIGTADDIKGHDYNKRIYSVEGKSPTIASHSGGNLETKIATDEKYYRKLLPIECERLQTVPENYTEGVSDTQRYKMLGNGWTIDVIIHILKYM